MLPAALLPPDAARVLFARQAIVDARASVAGYELLYRGERGADGEITDDEHATCAVLTGAFAEIGLDHAVGGSTAWVNVSDRFLFEFDPLPLPAGATVLELLEDHNPSPELIERLRALRTQGYRIALDDYVLSSESGPMLDVADIVKIDVLNTPQDVAIASIKALKRRGLTVVAEKVEDEHVRAWSLDAGADLLQGYFFCKPIEVHGGELRAANLSRLRAAAGLADPDAGLEEVEQAVRTDPDLSLRLLRYLNSAALSLRHEITSIKHAVVMLGPRQIRQWALVLLMAGIGERRGPLLPTALIRARMMELIAHSRGLPAPDAYFSVGLLSITDALAGMPLSDILAELPLADDVTEALLEHSGPMGVALEGAIACERGRLPEQDPGLMLACYADAVAWTETQGVH